MVSSPPSDWCNFWIRTGAEHSIWQARQKRCAPAALGVACDTCMVDVDFQRFSMLFSFLYIFFLSVSASFTSMIAIWVDGERLDLAVAFPLIFSLASRIREICVHYKSSYGSNLGPAHLDLNLWGQWLVQRGSAWFSSRCIPIWTICRHRCHELCLRPLGHAEDRLSYGHLMSFVDHPVIWRVGI